MLNLTDKTVQSAVREYTDKHGGGFFYEEPGNIVMYENEQGECFSFDNGITDEAFVALLKKDGLRLSPVKDTSGVEY
jgi:hypothetical protein